MTTDQITSPSVTPPLRESFWPRDSSVPLIEHTAGSLLAERARTHAGSLALVAGAHGTGEERRLGYEELYAEARRVAAGLLRLVEPGEHVALWAHNVVEWPIIQYGAALAGVTLVALNPVLRPDELLYALNHSRAAVLLHADRSRDYDLAAVAAEVGPRCPALRHTISLSAPERWTADPGGSAALPEVSPDAPAMLQYTSGTTGRPKGVLLSHRALVNVAKLTVEVAEMPSGAVCVAPLPMFHTAACVISTLGPLWLGGTVLLVERFEPAVVLRLIEREAATALFYVPTILIAVLEAARAGAGPMPRLTAVVGGGANVPGAVIDAVSREFGASVHNLFGQTELAPVLTLTRKTDTPEDLVNTVGRPIPQVDCKIADPVTRAVRPLGVEGEICARGYQQMIEYYDDPKATALAVDADGWVHTGDLGTMDERGVITVTGRIKDLIIRGGENIAPAEIESFLVAHELVVDATVVGVADDRWGETVGAVVVPREPGRPGLREELITYCRERLSPYKVPQHWFFVEALPLTATGKAHKPTIRSSIADGELRPVE
ncbi:AMP-binding protein [Streptosporangium sp. NBC_01810]|uniref:class I adenylate-forming enzyme family protein n=1 Tax=Streptosporangium sp. NBC_01810 TaxID=2975951 RepID=UPI002DDBF997|nr:AMP-binding protein [Streptosporangium sp. NBC_01810]WSA28987.1 AMP-binding protein [Streptosporangium sp. NBC_01810]